MNRGVPQWGRMTAVGASEQQLNVQVLEYGSLSWVNIERPGVAEMEYRKDRFSFHQLSLDDCLSVVQLPKLDEFDDHVFLVLHFPMFSREFRITRPSEVDVFAGANYIVTVHAGNLRPLTKLFDDCFPILNKLIAKVNETEERVFDACGQKVVREMAELRRDILSYRRLVRPQIELLEAMEVRQFQFLKVDQDIYFGDLADHVRRIWSELEDLKDVVESLYDLLQARLFAVKQVRQASRSSTRRNNVERYFGHIFGIASCRQHNAIRIGSCGNRVLASRSCGRCRTRIGAAENNNLVASHSIGKRCGSPKC